MLGFGKKKKKNETSPDASKQKEVAANDTENTSEKSVPKKKKLPLKKLMIILILLLMLAGAGFAVYKMFFSGSGGEQKQLVYEKSDLPYTGLPEEMVRFCFDHYPDFYSTLLAFNREMALINKEIDRITAIGEKYPEQIKIVDKEKKNWEKVGSTLEKVFLKLEKPVKETYVQFRVNKETGRAQIEARSGDISEQAQAALEKAMQHTEKFKTQESAPEGMIKGTVYKLKKKFL